MQFPTLCNLFPYVSKIIGNEFGLIELAEVQVGISIYLIFKICIVCWKI